MCFCRWSRETACCCVLLELAVQIRDEKGALLCHSPQLDTWSIDRHIFISDRLRATISGLPDHDLDHRSRGVRCALWVGVQKHVECDIGDCCNAGQIGWRRNLRVLVGTQRPGGRQL